MSRPKTRLKRVLIGSAIALCTPLLLYGGLLNSRPPRTDLQQQLYKGVVYRREVRSTPRFLIIHVVTVDLTTPGVRLLVTPGNVTPDGMEITAQTTSEFVTKYKLQLAVNSNFFHPFHSRGPVDYYPRSGDRVNVSGLAISNGDRYSPVDSKWPTLCISAAGRAQIFAENCPKGTVQGLAGSDIFLNRGLPVPFRSHLGNNDVDARTAVAIDERGEKLWLIVVDGSQPLYSNGVTLAEMANIVVELGADKAIQLDGGGSQTLVVAVAAKTRLLNAAFHNLIPMQERPVGNHLGIYALPN